MQTYNNEPNKEKKESKAAPDYWTPTYEEIQDKYSEDKYAEKQYLPEKATEGYGNEKANYLIANEYDNTIETYEKNDVVEAGYGNDHIDAGEGDDYLFGISKAHNPENEKYADDQYAEVDWYTGGGGQDIYALGTPEYAHYAANGDKDYAVIMDYTAGEDAVQLMGTSENYVVSEYAPEEKNEAISDKSAAIYWDKDENGSYSAGDDMVGVFDGYAVEDLTAAKDSFVYVASEPLSV